MSSNFVFQPILTAAREAAGLGAGRSSPSSEENDSGSRSHGWAPGAHPETANAEHQRLPPAENDVADVGASSAMLALFVGIANSSPTMTTISAHARPMSVNAPRARTCQLHAGPKFAPAPLPKRSDAHSMHSELGMDWPLSSCGAPLH